MSRATTPEPAKVSSQATQADVLPLGGTTLLGTRHSPKGSSALIRAGNGRVRRVKRGDSVNGHTVVAIGNGQIRLARGEKEQLLAIAGS